MPSSSVAASQAQPGYFADNSPAHPSRPSLSISSRNSIEPSTRPSIGVDSPAGPGGYSSPTAPQAQSPLANQPSSLRNMSYNSASHQYGQQPGGPGSPAISSPSLNGGMTSFPSSGFAAGMGSAQSQQPQTPGTGMSDTGQQHEVVPTSFDEATLRALCDTDVGLPLLYERIKQSMTSCREASAFFKKRAAIEEEYGRSLQKLYKGSLESYGAADAKAGSYVTSWHTILATHEPLADGRIRFAQRLTEMSEELNNLVKEVDRNRKTARDTGVRLERGLLDAEASVEKARVRFDTAAEELERLLLLKSGESTKGGELAASHAANSSSGPGGQVANKGRSLGKAMTKGGMLFKNKNPQQLLRQEEDIRSRTSSLSDAFRREVLQTQQMRQEYFNLQLPRILRSLKESAEEIDNGLQYHLTRYAFLYESTLLSDGMTVTPVGAAAADGNLGFKQAAEAIDNRADFKTFMQNYQVLHARDYKGPRREGQYEEGNYITGSGAGVGNGAAGGTGMQGSASRFGSSGAASSSSSGAVGGPPARPIFGVDLATQMARDNVDVPGILEKCAEAVEAFGKENMGIYRLSGTTSKVQRLKGKFDADWTAVDLFEDREALSDVNIVSGCLKLWFRELPEPLLTWELYRSFVDAARVENDRLRHIRLHEVVNQLPDANYSTLKALMGHLDRIRAEEALNQMSASNLAIVFGPTLLRAPPPGMVFEGHGAGGSSGLDDGGAGGGAADGEGGAAEDASGSGAALQDMQYQAKAVETILVHYRDIFLEDDEIEAMERQQQQAAQAESEPPSASEGYDNRV